MSRRRELLLCIQCCLQKCQNRKKKNQPFLKLFLTKGGGEFFNPPPDRIGLIKRELPAERDTTYIFYLYAT